MAYTVQTGRVFRLDSIAYEGFWPDADSLIKASQAETKLHKGDAFNVVNLSDEQKRIETLLRENGYYYYSAPYATFKADTTQHPYRVSLKLMPTDNITQRQKSRWYMGRTYISLKRTDTDIPNRRFSSRDSSYTFFWSGEKMPLKPRMWFHAITQRRGDLYSLSDQNMTQEKSEPSACSAKWTSTIFHATLRPRATRSTFTSTPPWTSCTTATSR